MACALCTREHPPCEFTAGSLYCRVVKCKNPHHRPKGPSAAELIAGKDDGW